MDACVLKLCTAVLEGGGVWASGDLFMDKCVVNGNSVNHVEAGSGGGVYHYRWTGTDPEVHITNSIISGNVAILEGGGLWIETSDLELRNCTIVNNRVTAADPGCFFGGGVVVRYSPGEIKNCILWGNAVEDTFGPLGDQISFSNCGSPTSTVPSILYSNIQGGSQNVYNLDYANQWGPGNISADPQFVDPVLDFHIRVTSPCINGGDPSYLSFPGEVDIDGESRILQSRIDIGADEKKSKIGS